MPERRQWIEVAAGFCAPVFADGIGHARHMVVGPSAVVDVNTWPGDYFGSDKPHEGGFFVALRDKTGTGKADVLGAGCTGIGLSAPLSSPST